MDVNHAETTKQCEDTTRTSYFLKEEEEIFSVASIELLKKCRRKMNILSSENSNLLRLHSLDDTFHQSLSTQDIIKIARERYLQYVSQTPNELSMLFHPINSNHSGLSCESTEDVDLVLNLLASAEEVVHQQYSRASNMLSLCYQVASPNGNPVKRVIYYFSEALQERILQETRNLGLEGAEYNKREPMQLQEALTKLHPALIACQQQLPFNQVTQFAGMQAILDSVSSARRIHIVDLGIRSGMHWIILMQALAVRHECPLELLTVTGVIMSSREEIEETGTRLSSFAESLNLPFVFKLVVIDKDGFSEDVFSFKTGEAVAVYSQLFLAAMLAQHSRLEALMGVIKKIHPRVMVVAEIEAHTNLPNFMDRLMEALSLYGSLFDCVGACMDSCNEYRMTTEAIFLWEGIQNTITSEGEKWIHRYEKINHWRAFFGRFGVVEMDFGASSLYQAELVSKKFAFGGSCTLHLNGKCLLVGWKGTPLYSLSAWKFDQD